MTFPSSETIDSEPKSRTTSDWAKLSKPERMTFIYRIRVWYPRMKSIYDEIVRAYEMNPTTPDPECIALLGDYRTGKTTIVESFYRLHPRMYTEVDTRVPILKCAMPGKATMNAMLTAMLAELGDPLADRSSISSKQHRLKRFLVDCGVQMVIMDEANHFVDRDSERVLHDVSNTLKVLVKECNIACVLVGLPYTEEVLNANEQFGSLFGDPFMLDPFHWDEERPETIDEFRMFLQQVERQLPLPSRSFLASRAMAWRCFVATQGKVGFIMRLIRRAAELAVRNEEGGLSQALLADAFARTLAGNRRGLSNPFTGDMPTSGGPVEAQYWPPRRRRTEY